MFKLKLEIRGICFKRFFFDISLKVSLNLINYAILIETYQERANCSTLLEIKSRLGNKEVMPMIESSKCMGHQVAVYRLCAGAVL